MIDINECGGVDALTHKRMLHESADQVRVARVVGMNGDGRVAEHRLGPSGGDHNLLVGQSLLVLGEDAIGERGERAELDLVGIAGYAQIGLALERHLVDLDVGDGRVERARPVDESLVAVDEALLVQAHERLEDGAHRHVVHGEARSVPVARRADALELVHNGVALLLLPLPDLLDERLAAQVVARLVQLALELLLDDHLGGDAGVVEARKPARLVAEHAVPARQRVLYGAHERVAEMQRARHVRRRHGDHELLARFALRLRKVDVGRLGLEEARLLPPRVPGRLHVTRAIGVRERAHRVLLLARLRLTRVDRSRWRGGGNC